MIRDLTADQVAAELTTVERAAATGDASVGPRQQLLYRYMSAHPELDEETLTNALGCPMRGQGLSCNV